MTEMTTPNSLPDNVPGRSPDAVPSGWDAAPGPAPSAADGPAGAPIRRRWTAAVAIGLALAIGGGAGGAVLADRLPGAAAPAATSTAGTPATAVAATTVTRDSLASVVKTVSPSIVTITVDGAQSAIGSGVVLGSAGLVLTNQHVVASGGTLTVKLSDGRTAPASLVGQDRAADLALLRVNGVSGLSPATLGTDTGLKVGDTVLAFGSPLGLEGTVTAGIVSAVDRTVDDVSVGKLIQTDAAINAGNSGGALVDTAGRVVGINVAIATTGADSGNIGVGFAVPAGTVRSVVRQLTGDDI